MSFAYVKIQTADGHSAKQLADLLRMRQEWLGETARQSVEACAVETLRSLRA